VRRAALGLAAGALLLLPAAAQARQDQARLALRADALALPGDRITVRGTLTPFVPGQRIVVRVYRGGRKLLARGVEVRPAAGGTRGSFRVRVRSRRPGVLHVRASHRATPELGTLRARTLRVRIIRPSAGPGARGPAVRLLQRRLAGLHYAVPTHGVYDAGTGRAVMAYRKVTGMRRTTFASEPVFRALLRGRGAFRVRHPEAGHHIEADISRQVLALIDGRRVRSIYHTSSGTGGTPTVLGRFRVYSKTPGVNSKGMVHSLYFIRGYAIHGYASVPPFPASHGCLRVPIPNARSIFDWLRHGDIVWVYP
jgi:hypothetical protein